MNAKNIFACACASFLLSLGAQAAIIDGTFKAKVAGAEPVAGLWGDIAGETISGTFSYDTAMVEKSLFIEPNEVRYFNHSNAFVNMSFNIAGKTFDISRDHASILPPGSLTDFVLVQDAALNPSDDAYDYFGLLDAVEYRGEGFDYIQLFGQLYIVEPVANIINTTALEQQFEWISDGSEGQSGFGSFGYNYNYDGVSVFGYLHLEISEVTASLRKSSVPEPSALLLLSIALLGVALRAIPNRKKS